MISKDLKFSAQVNINIQPNILLLWSMELQKSEWWQTFHF